MAISKAVEVVFKTDNLAESAAFYKKLGFKPLADDVFTDGSINLRLDENALHNTYLQFYGSDLDAIKKAGIKLDDANSVHDPNGALLVFKVEEAPHPMPEGDPMTRTPLSRLGKMGEYSIGTKDRDQSIAFWEKVGFKNAHISDEPYKWGIVLGDHIAVGLHEYETDDILIAYFATDGGERIQALAAEGITMRPTEAAEDTSEHALFTSPDGHNFMIATGDF